MAGLADIILATNPVTGMQKGMQSGEQLGGSAQNAFANMIKSRAMKQQMAQNAVMAPYKLQQQQTAAQYAAPLDQAKINSLLRPPSSPTAQIQGMVNLYHHTSDPMTKNAIAAKINALRGKSGLSIQSSPSGGFSVSTGDSSGGQIVPYVDDQGNPIPISPPPVGLGKIPGRGAQTQITQNPDGTYTGTITPSTATRTAASKAEQAEAESKVLMNFVTPGLTNYEGGQGWGRMISDLWNQNSSPEARKRLHDFGLSRRLLSEALANQGRLAGLGQIGAEDLKLLESRFPALPPGEISQFFYGTDLNKGINKDSADLNYAAAKKRVAAAMKGSTITVKNLKDLPDYFNKANIQSSQNNISQKKDFLKYDSNQLNDIASGAN